MIICEHRFEEEDPRNLGFSMLEIDIYTSVKRDAYVLPHRLSLRKNISRGEFELYRFYFYTGQTSVQFRDKDLQRVLDHANAEAYTWSGIREPDKVCLHKGEQKDRLCPIEEELT